MIHTVVKLDIGLEGEAVKAIKRITKFGLTWHA